MSSFDLWTEISIQIFAPHPVGRADIRNTYQPSELPPFLGRGLIIKPNSTPEIWGFQPGGQAWSPNLPSLPSGTVVGNDDQVFSLHDVKVGNRLGVAGVDPSLERGPDVSEILPGLISGLPDMSAISFKLLNARFQRWFSSDFVSIQGLVVVTRVSSTARLDVWRGLITKVSFIDGVTSVSARPEIKKLDVKATFGFDDDILDWWPTYKMPIVSAVMIPYSVKVIRHSPTLANSYGDWYEDFSKLVGTPYAIDGKEEEYLNHLGLYVPSPLVPFDVKNVTEEELQQRRSLFASRIRELSNPDYVSFDKRGLIRCTAYPITQKRYKEGNNPVVDVQGEDTGVFWVKVDRGIFILPSEESTPLIEGSVEAMEHHPHNFRECSLPDGAGLAFDGGLLERVNFASIPFQINTGDSFCSWGVAGLSFDHETAELFSISEGFNSFDSKAEFRIPHPLDFMYKYETLGGLFSIFINYVIHGLDRFFQVSVFPTGYYRDHWITYSRQDMVATLFEIVSQGDPSATRPTYGLQEFHSFFRKPKVYGLRSKDMYSTESTFKRIQSATPGNDVDLSSFLKSPFSALFSSNNVLMPNSTYTGKAANMLRLMPGIRREHFPVKDSTRVMQSPNVEYKRSPNKGGAYAVSATYMLDSENAGFRDIRQAMLKSENSFDDYRVLSGLGNDGVHNDSLGPFVGIFIEELHDGSDDYRLYLLPRKISTNRTWAPRGWALPVDATDTKLVFTPYHLLFDPFEGYLDVTYYNTFRVYYVAYYYSGRIIVGAVLKSNPNVFDTSDSLHNLQLSNDEEITSVSIAVTDKYFYAVVDLGEPGQVVRVWDKLGSRVAQRDLILGDFRIAGIEAVNFGTFTDEDDYVFVLAKNGRVLTFRGRTSRQVDYMRYPPVIEGNSGTYAGVAGVFSGLNFYLYVLRYEDGYSHPFHVAEIKTSNEVERTLIWNDKLTYREGKGDEPQRRNWGTYFQYYYHHDMYGVHDAHLRPTTYVYAVLKNAGMEPGFKQDGEDVPGRINAHKMQMIEDTSTTYRKLLQRLLPSLGYILRFNASTGKAELVDIATNQHPKWEMGDNIVQVRNIESDFSKQYSSYFFENRDMIAGENTLEEWKNDALQQGRFTIFNSNPFIQGRNKAIQTGTWTSEYEKVATMLSVRKDQYTWQISNYSLLEISDDLLGGPLIGDRVRLKSVQIPNKSKEVIVLITQIRQDESMTEYKGTVFGA